MKINTIIVLLNGNLTTRFSTLTVLTKPESVVVFLSSDTKLLLGLMARLLFNILLSLSGVQEELPLPTSHQPLLYQL